MMDKNQFSFYWNLISIVLFIYLLFFLMGGFHFDYISFFVVDWIEIDVLLRNILKTNRK